MRRHATELALLVAASAAVLAGVLVYRALLGNPGGPTWTAEFVNSRGLLAGNDVRDDGAVVGRVTKISLTRRGDALVSFQLSDHAAAPRADAVAAIEAADLLGDNYLSLSPGASPRPLHGPIPAARTVDAPRLDELLDAFTPGVRESLRTLLAEGGLALEGRAAALSRTTVAVRPALAAAGSVLAELNGQNGSLARLVPVAQRAAAQLDSRRADIGPLTDELARTLGGTAGAAGALDSGLAGLPATLAQLRATADGVSSLSTAATPVSGELQRAVAPLGRAVAGLPALIQRTRAAAPSLQRALVAAGAALRSGTPGLRELAGAFPALTRQAPQISALMSELDAAAPGIAEGFFVDFPDQAAESGTQPFDPFADPRRAYWRGAAVLSCEAFGVPVAPGCLTQAITNLAKQPPQSFQSTSTLLRFLLHR